MIAWRREWQPTPVFLPGELHGQRNLVGYSSWGRKELVTTEDWHYHTLSSGLRALHGFDQVHLATTFWHRQYCLVKSLSRVWPFATPWTVAHQAPPSMGFSRQEYWSGLSFPSPGDLPNLGIEPRSSAFQADALTSEPPGFPRQYCLCVLNRWGSWGVEELHLTSGCLLRWRMDFNTQAVYSTACGLIIVVACLPDRNAYGVRERGGQHDQGVNWDPCLREGWILNTEAWARHVL